MGIDIGLYNNEQTTFLPFSPAFTFFSPNPSPPYVAIFIVDLLGVAHHPTLSPPCHAPPPLTKYQNHPTLVKFVWDLLTD